MTYLVIKVLEECSTLKQAEDMADVYGAEDEDVHIIEMDEDEWTQ